MKKKVTALLMALALAVSVCACSKGKTKETEKKLKQTTEETEDDFDGKSGENAVIKDLENHGFTVKKNPAAGYAQSLDGYQKGFDAETSDGSEHYCYRIYDSKDKIDELDKQGLPFEANGRVRICFGGIIWHYATDEKKGEFQYIVMNPETFQVLYYMGPTDKGTRSNCYAFEMGLIPQNSVTVPFEDDPEYPEGKGLTKTPDDAPQVPLENDKAAAVMEDAHKEGNIVITLPAVGLNISKVLSGRAKGFMLLGEYGEYENDLIVYVETDTPDTESTFKQLQKELEDDGEVYTFEKRGNCQYGTNPQSTVPDIIIFDMETGYYLKLITGSDGRAAKLISDLGFDI